MSRNTALCVVVSALVSLWLLACQEPEKPAASKPVNLGPVATPEGTPDDPALTLDKSPMDMAYFPVDYPKQKMIGTAAALPVARVIYSRPKKDDRAIFGDVLKYGAPWRLGANEATEIEFFSDVSINNQRVNKGRYVIYCMPYPDNWQLRLNTEMYTWGLKIDSTRDAYRFSVPVKKAPLVFERFTMEFAKADRGMELHIAWDTLYASLPILY